MHTHGDMGSPGSASCGTNGATRGFPGAATGQRARDDHQIARPEAALPGAATGQRARDDRQIARPEAVVPGAATAHPRVSVAGMGIPQPIPTVGRSTHGN